MPERLKTDTVNGDTYRLYRQPTDMKGEQYEYFVTENGTTEASRATQKVFSMERGKALFETTLRQVGGADTDSGGGSSGDAGTGGVGFGVGLGGGDPPPAEDDPLSLDLGDTDSGEDDGGFRLL